MTSVALQLPASWTIAGTAHHRGGPNTVYDLTGNDCSSGQPYHVWATGLADAAGTAKLTSHP